MSDKCNVIDHATFQQIQKSSSETGAAASRKIRNSKYKRMSAANNFHLLQFVKPNKPRKRSGVVKKDKIRERTIVTDAVKKAKKGKQRENGKLRKPTRLKKSILQYRKQKREQTAKVEEQINTTIDQIQQLKLDDDEDENKEKLVPNIHSNKYRPYCNCRTTPELKKYCEELVRSLNFFQRRAFAQNEIKARAHKRFVIGFRQTQNYLRINKVKLIIIATDCEHNEGDVTVDQTIENIKTVCNDQQIPVVFALLRRQLAYFLYKKASVSCIGILDYDGARDTVAQLLEALKEAREQYDSILQNKSM